MNTSRKMTNKKTYPPELEEAILKSLSFYPELVNVEIHFKYAAKLSSSVMQAQPKISSLFLPPEKRSYVIRMRKSFNMEGEIFHIHTLPFEVLVGWLGHELGHIMDYLHRSFFSLAGFGFGYILSDNFLKGAERTADEFAVSHGMGEFIQATKNFILQHAHFPEAYKDKIKRLYLSPEEIIEIVEDHKIPESLR